MIVITVSIILDRLMRLIWQVWYEVKSADQVEHCCNTKSSSCEVKWLLVIVVVIHQAAEYWRAYKLIRQK